MNEETHDSAPLRALLQRDGGELGSLYRRLPHIEPPARIDRAILGEAARAVRGLQPTGPRRSRWFATAAGLVLAAGISWRVGHDFAGAPPVPTRPPVIPIEAIDATTRLKQGPAEPAAARESAAAESTPRRRAPSAAKAIQTPVPAAPAVEQSPRREEPAPSADVETEAASVPPHEHAGAMQSLQNPVRDGHHDEDRQPTERILQIRALLKQGRRAAALAELRKLREAYPEATLPADLERLLEPEALP